jgi:hypothetical protein
MYRTLYFRYISQNRCAELLDLLYDGSLLLFSHNQQASATDLAILLVDVLNKSDVDFSDEILDKLSKLYSLTSPDAPERSTFLQSALKWSSKDSTEYRSGHPKLHQMVATTLWKEQNYPLSRYHYLHSLDGDGCAAMLVEYHVNKGYPREVDLFIAQVVLQYLCLRNKSTAALVFFSYTRHHPDIPDGPPFLLPLLNFVWFLLLAVESEKLAVFTVLCEKYQPSIKRDPTYPEYLEKIGQLFFGLPPPKAARGNMFGNLLQTLFSDLDGDDDSSEVSGSHSGRDLVRATLQTEDLD